MGDFGKKFKKKEKKEKGNLAKREIEIKPKKAVTCIKLRKIFKKTTVRHFPASGQTPRPKTYCSQFKASTKYMRYSISVVVVVVVAISISYLMIALN